MLVINNIVKSYNKHRSSFKFCLYFLLCLLSAGNFNSQKLLHKLSLIACEIQIAIDHLKEKSIGPLFSASSYLLLIQKGDFVINIHQLSNTTNVHYFIFSASKETCFKECKGRRQASFRQQPE